MEVRHFPERRNWRDTFLAQGLGHECESWADDLCAVIPARELSALTAAAESVSERMKDIATRCLTEFRLKKPWQFEASREEAIRRSLADRPSLSLQRLDYVQSGDGVFHLSSVVINPVEGVLACALLQRQWHEERVRGGHMPHRFEQFNRLDAVLTERLEKVADNGKPVHVLFEPSDRISAAMAAYAVRQGIMATAEMVLTDVAGIRNVMGVARDGKGDRIELGWDCTRDGRCGQLDHPEFHPVEFMTPAWHFLLPSVFEKMGEIGDILSSGARSQSRGIVGGVSVWLLDASAVAVSCTALDKITNEPPMRIAHVIK